MDSLPLELKQRVCSYLTPRDLKLLRLASKVCSIAACRHIMPRVFLHNHPNSFQEIKDIAEHPILSQRITTLVIDTSRFRSCPISKQWSALYIEAEEYIPDWADFEPPNAAQEQTDARSERALRRAKASYQQAVGNAPYTAEDLEGDWNAYQSVAGAQSQPSAKVAMLDSIAVAFKAFSRLVDLVIAHGRWDNFDTGRRARIFGDFPNSIHALKIIRPWRLEHGLQATRYSLGELIEAAGQNDRVLHSLVMIDAPFSPDQSVLPERVFTNLKHLRYKADPNFTENQTF
ncbi:hypothetical protein E4T38_03834 [Aureobasidium subglaciale]|nr:hypothetical protein E4T38_03834 [Aureobasidium subglaciale]KAI5225093.1 hypothetical protein E4T40_03609 [Aureobasidium subglaciale]KAI5228714.1 hypothetical protein E4T41_03674 [Aureobasidium subglaciale]KAI5263717.1 hypothetical protein E4T46_03450 [Aureobasidium subglaciale]